MYNACYGDLKWVKSSPARLQTGVRGGRVPFGAIRGGNGTFLVIDNPAELYLTVLSEDGRRITSDNFISDLRRITGWERITENRVEKLKSFLRGQVFTVTVSGEISNLFDILEIFSYKCN